MNMLVLLLEKQRRRMNMHDVIQVWHTVHAAMHCVSSSTAACIALCFSASQARKGRPDPDVWNSNVYLPLPPDMCMCAYCIFQARVVMDQQSHTGTGPHPSSPRSITKARQQVCGLPRGSPRTTGAGKRNHMVRPWSGVWMRRIAGAGKGSARSAPFADWGFLSHFHNSFLRWSTMHNGWV